MPEDQTDDTPVWSVFLSVHLFRAADITYTKRHFMCLTVTLLPDTHESSSLYQYVWTFLDSSLKCVLPASVPEYLTGVSDSDWCQASSLLSQTFVAHIDVLQVYGLAHVLIFWSYIQHVAALLGQITVSCLVGCLSCGKTQPPKPETCQIKFL